jgi:hypothetical protein
MGKAFPYPDAKGRRKGRFVAHEATADHIRAVGINKCTQRFFYLRVVQGDKEDRRLMSLLEQGRVNVFDAEIFCCWQ